MYRLYIVEDDPGITGAIARIAGAWDLEAQCAEDFRDIIGEFVRFQPHIVLMDITLPFFDGYHWCSEIRRVSNVPIIFISSADTSMNIVMAMNMGADDFISTPFDSQVLMAKIQALLRRAYDFAGTSSLLEHRGAILNTSDATLTYMGEPVALTKNEFKILSCLLENKGRVVSRERLMERLWRTESFIDDNTLTVNVNRLRRKLDAAGLYGFIGTRPGLGYIVE